MLLYLVTQLCPTFCDHMDYSLPGSCVHGILQARILEWVLYGIFPAQGSNPDLLHCRLILYLLSHQGSPNYNPVYVFVHYWILLGKLNGQIHLTWILIIFNFIEFENKLPTKMSDLLCDGLFFLPRFPVFSDFQTF